jgi:hypothetical protein
MSFFSTPSAPSPSKQLGKIIPLLEQAYPTLAQEANDSANSNVGAQSAAQLSAAQATSPAYAQLMSQLYAQYAPQLAATGSQVGQQIQQSQAGANAAVANSSQGQAALQAAINADKTANPQFYATRDLESSRLNDLMSSIDLSGKLSGSETRQIGQSLAQQNNQTGTVNTPSALNTTSNAMTYGNAVYQRQEQAKSDLSGALGQASNFLPVSKSSVDSWNAATGGSNTATNSANNAVGQFSGVNNTTANSSASSSLLGSLFGNSTSLSGSTVGANAGQGSTWQTLAPIAVAGINGASSIGSSASSSL